MGRSIRSRLDSVFPKLCPSTCESVGKRIGGKLAE